jgi:hypothetical protein
MINEPGMFPFNSVANALGGNTGAVFQAFAMLLKRALVRVCDVKKQHVLVLTQKTAAPWL